MEAGETFALLSRPDHQITVAEILRIYAFEKDDVETMQRVVQLEDLSAAWREYFQQQIEKRVR